MIKVSDWIADFIANCELVSHDIFLVSGGGNMHLLHSIGTHPRLNIYCNHHEQASAMAAEGYARVTNKIGIALVTTGPGGTNAITGAMGAWVDSIPMLIISGQVKLSTTIKQAPVLRQLGDQEINIADIVRPITKYAVMVEDKYTIAYHLEKAIYLAKDGRPGPVWIDIPLDIQDAFVEEEKLHHFELAELPPAFKQKIVSSQINQLLQLLRNKRRPVLIAGNGVRLSGAKEQFVAFAEKLGVPVMTAISGIDLIPSNHPLFFGRPGVIGERAANFIFQNSDLLIVLGTRLNLRIIGFDFSTLARAATRVMIDIDEAELNKPTFPIDVPIHCDAAYFMERMMSELQDSGFDSSFDKWFEYCRRLKTKYAVVMPEHRDASSCVSSYYFVERLSEFLNDQDIIVTGNGTAYTTMHQAFQIRSGQRMFANVGCAAMGYDLPAAIGACIASGKRRVICVTGDGSIQMNLQELQTVVHHHLPIKIFMLENEGYLSIKNTQESFFNSCFVGCSHTCGVTIPQMLKIAEAYGIPTYYAENNLHLDEAIANTLDAEGPAFCELKGNPHERLGPKTSSYRKADGTLASRPLEDLAPLLPRDEFMENMLIPAADSE